MSDVPVQNIYYLLCYAWEQWEAGRQVPVGDVAGNDTRELLAMVLDRGVRRLLRRGLDRGYRSRSREVAGVRGQIDFNASLSRQTFASGRAQCRVDELSRDVLHNRLLKATLQALARSESLQVERRERLWELVRRMRDISKVELDPLRFGRIQLHRNNRVYRLLLDVCELVARNLMPAREGGGRRFRDFLEDDAQMGRLFESFVANFYRREQSRWRVGANERIAWKARAQRPADMALLPGMETDVTLHRPGESRIIDTKFYSKTLTGRFSRDRVRSGHLYQLYAYLKNFEPKADATEVSGMLLYPTVDASLDLDYSIDGHRVRVCTVDLARPWPQVHERLLGLAGAP